MDALSQLHRKYIEGTVQYAIVVNLTIFLCHLTEDVKNSPIPTVSSVYLKTRVLKHLYDSKPAEEYDFLLKNLHEIVKYPEHIYEDLPAKRGVYCFVKKIKNEDYICFVEPEEYENTQTLTVVTAFRLRKLSYLKRYTLLWSWKGGTPSS